MVSLTSLGYKGDSGFIRHNQEQNKIDEQQNMNRAVGIGGGRPECGSMYSELDNRGRGDWEIS